MLVFGDELSRGNPPREVQHPHQQQPYVCSNTTTRMGLPRPPIIDPKLFPTRNTQNRPDRSRLPSPAAPPGLAEREALRGGQVVKNK